MLFERHYESIKRFFASKLSNDIHSPQHLQELVQETFVRCCENRDRIEHADKFRSYLFSIAFRVLMQYLRNHYRHREYIDYTEVSIHDLAPGARSLLSGQEDKQLLCGALRRLPIISQIIIELRYWEGLKICEIADVFEVPNSTAWSRLERARELLVAAMGQLKKSPELVAATFHGFETWVARCRDAAAQLAVQ